MIMSGHYWEFKAEYIKLFPAETAGIYLWSYAVLPTISLRPNQLEINPQPRQSISEQLQ